MVFTLLYSVIFQIVNDENESLEFSPSFDEFVIEVEAMIEHIVEGVTGLSRIEKHLFQTQEGLDVQEISVMQIKEKPVKEAKSRIEKVIRKNTSGPERYIQLILLSKLSS